MAKEIAEEYASSLADLTVNSKPLINMLTILAEENIDHAGTIVETVEKHLEKVNPEVKLPVLYLVDSIIKNVGGAYTQKFSQSIVNMFTRTFKQVDEKVRSQMFKLRETWHDVFPATKLYQLDVKVNLIDPAWPIQAQPQQSNIHVNPNFLKKTGSTSAVAEEDDKMRSILAKKEQELLMLQKKKVEMELEQVRRQLEQEKVTKKVTTAKAPLLVAGAMPIAMVNPVAPLAPAPEVAPVSVKQRLGPPVGKASGRIAPVSAALAAARRDPRLARHAHPSPHAHPAPVAALVPPPPVIPTAPIAPNVFDIKPLERVTKRKNVITIDVRPEARRRDPRLERRRERRDKDKPAKRDDRPAAAYMNKIADARDISKLPPIPKINREGRDEAPSPTKRKKESRDRRKKTDIPKEDTNSSNSSPEKKARPKKKVKQPPSETEVKPEEVVPFKELKNYHKERYMRRNREKSESPEKPAEKPAEPAPPETDLPNVPEAISENKDVDLRVLPVVDPKAAVVAQKRPSTEALETKTKKNRVDKFDILFGNEDVDLRQLPQVEEVAPPPPVLSDSPQSPEMEPTEPKPMSEDEEIQSPKESPKSPKKDWNEVKEKAEKEAKKTPSKLDLVRAKLAEATKGKDRLGRPLLFSKSPSIEKERRRTISFEDTDMRNESGDDFDAEDNKKTISIIMSQAKEQFNDGQLDKNQYNALMYQVFQLNEKLKLKEAKQRESLEVSKLKLKEAKQRNRDSLEASKRKLKAHIEGENKVATPKSSPNRFGDIDERIVPSAFIDTPLDSQGFTQDSDMRTAIDTETHKHALLPLPPAMPMFHAPNHTVQFGPMWRGTRPRMEEFAPGHRPRMEDFGPRRFRGPAPPFFRGNNKRLPRPQFDRMPLAMPPLPTPKMGICQGECPLPPYERTESPPPLGAPGFFIPPTDFNVIEYIDQDPVKTIQIDGIPREIRFYGDTAVIMLDWDDPREIKFLPGCRRVTFDNKDSVVLSFNEGYKQVEIEDQVFDIKFGAPTRELYINGRWHECVFGGSPLGVIIDGKPRLVHLEGPLPQVDIGKVKRTDLVVGKINLIVNATQMYPVYLDAKVQKFVVDNQLYTIRFVDALRTVLINEQPFKVEYGDLPKPIFIGNGKHFIRFSALPKNVKPGFVQIANMEGCGIPTVPLPNFPMKVDGLKDEKMEVDDTVVRPVKTPSPELNQEHQGLDMLASVMPTTMEFASGSDYSVAEPLFPKSDKIPGLEAAAAEKPVPINLPGLGNINVTDLFAKLVATGIVQQAPKEVKEAKEREQPREDRNAVHKVDMLRPETLRGKQPGIVSKLYGGMQCSGCGSRFPPEQTVRYSQHLDWHFRQNRRERDSARRAHSRHWHYDLSDWLQYEEIDELDEREKNWFETAGAEEGAGGGAAEGAADTPSVACSVPAAAHCAVCGDAFLQFYNEDREEWHLRNSVTHHDLNYHPLCLEDYKASLMKEEKKAVELEAEGAVEAADEPIVIRDVDEAPDQSDSESVVEVLEDTSDKPLEPPLEIYEDELEDGDEDDVIYKAEPVEQVLVEEVDTDDETSEARARRDRQAEIDFARVKVKQEPIDPDDEPVITAEAETAPPAPEPPLAAAHSSIDGNSQLESAAPAPAPAAIRINISKAPIPSIVTAAPIMPIVSQGSMLEDISTETDDEPLPPGEEMELQYKIKPTLEGVRLTRTAPQKKGMEESGLCSIM